MLKKREREEEVRKTLIDGVAKIKLNRIKHEIDNINPEEPLPIFLARLEETTNTNLFLESTKKHLRKKINLQTLRNSSHF